MPVESSVNKTKDKLSETIIDIVKASNEPMETKEIEAVAAQKTKGVTRSKLFYRLNMLRAEGTIKGKFVGPGKGVWIWWKKEDGK